MTHKFLPCLMQLKLSSEGDQAYINEIQKIWCLLLDKLERQYSSRLTLCWSNCFSVLFSNGTITVIGRISSTLAGTTHQSTLSLRFHQQTSAGWTIRWNGARSSSSLSLFLCKTERAILRTSVSDSIQSNNQFTHSTCLHSSCHSTTNASINGQCFWRCTGHRSTRFFTHERGWSGWISSFTSDFTIRAGTRQHVSLMEYFYSISK